MLYGPAEGIKCVHARGASDCKPPAKSKKKKAPPVCQMPSSQG